LFTSSASRPSASTPGPPTQQSIADIRTRNFFSAGLAGGGSSPNSSSTSSSSPYRYFSGDLSKFFSSSSAAAPSPELRGLFDSLGALERFLPQHTLPNEPLNRLQLGTLAAWLSPEAAGVGARSDAAELGKAGKRSEVNVWIGTSNVTTVLHYDAYHNTYVQLYGHKRFLLAPPRAFWGLYLYPATHPSDRQSQVRPGLLDPDLGEFPGFEGVPFWQADLLPGDVLCLPAFWFHQVQAKSDSISVSVWAASNEYISFQHLMGDPLPFYRPSQWPKDQLLVAVQSFLPLLLEFVLGGEGNGRRGEGQGLGGAGAGAGAGEEGGRPRRWEGFITRLLSRSHSHVFRSAANERVQVG
jgi:hypothetical protein